MESGPGTGDGLIIDLAKKGHNLGLGLFPNILSSKPEENNYFKIMLVTSDSNEELVSFTVKDIDCVLLGESGDAKMDATLLSWKESLPAGKMQATFKHLCGEYQTASSFGVWCAANLLRYQTVPDALRPVGKAEELRRILVFNSYRNNNCSLFLLEKIDR